MLLQLQGWRTLDSWIDGSLFASLARNRTSATLADAPADGHTGVAHLAATWDDITAADPQLSRAMAEMTRRYGYHMDPAKHPQSLDTSAFKA